VQDEHTQQHKTVVKETKYNTEGKCTQQKRRTLANIDDNGTVISGVDQTTSGRAERKVRKNTSF
jgi:hypothetical protein